MIFFFCIQRKNEKKNEKCGENRLFYKKLLAIVFALVYNTTGIFYIIAVFYNR